MRSLVFLLLLFHGVCFSDSVVRVSPSDLINGDCTAALQKAIDSGASVIELDGHGGEWRISETIRLRDDLHLVLREDTILAAAPGAFSGQFDVLFSGRGVKNVTIRGTGNAEIRMRKGDYQDTRRYSPSEWRHAIAFYSASDIRISNLRITASGGDGIYLGRDEEKPQSFCRNVLIDKVVAGEHNRQGISVISAENVMIQNSDFFGTSGRAPMAGIDLEPNNPSERIVNCTIRNCRFWKNDGGGVMIAVNSSIPLSVTVEDCHFFNQARPIVCYTLRNQKTTGFLKISRTLFENIDKEVFHLLDHASDSFQIEVKECRWIQNNGKKIPLFSFIGAHDWFSSLGGLQVKGMSAEGAIGDLLVLKRWFPQIILQAISGTVEVNGVMQPLPEKYSSPVSQTTAIKPYTWNPDLWRIRGAGSRRQWRSPLFRERAEFLFWGTPGETVSVNLSYRKISNLLNSAPVTLLDSKGRKTGEEPAFKPGEERKITFQLPQDGMIRMVCDAGRNVFTVSTGGNLQWAVWGDGTHLFRSSNMSGCFFVPAEVRSFSITLHGDPGEAVGITVLDPDGKTVLQAVPADEPRTFLLQNENGKSGIWHFQVPFAREDWYLTFSGIPPFWSGVPEHLPMPR